MTQFKIKYCYFLMCFWVNLVGCLFHCSTDTLPRNNPETVFKFYWWILTPNMLFFQLLMNFNTQYAILPLIEKEKETLDGKGYTGAVLMTLSKAFDTINCELFIAKLYAYFIAKLYAYRFSKNVMKLILSYMWDHWQRWKITRICSRTNLFQYLS